MPAVRTRQTSFAVRCLWLSHTSEQYVAGGGGYPSASSNYDYDDCDERTERRSPSAC